MHELSIALSLVDLACEEAGRLEGGRVEALHVQVGVLSGVVKDALLFSFDVAAAGSSIDGARLEVIEIPATVWCGTCEATRTLQTIQRRRCPSCDEPTPHLVTGEELTLVSLEVCEDDAPNRRSPPEHPARQ